MEDRSLAILVTVFLVAAAIALGLALFLHQTAEAAPVKRTCFEYPVTLHHVSCTLGWCSSWEDIHLDGLRVLTVRVTGWKLRNGMIRPVRVCR